MSESGAAGAERHTPGPWMAMRRKEPWVSIRAAGSYREVATAWNDPDNREAAPFDAALIAEAPALLDCGRDLLAALDAIMAHPEYMAVFATAQAHRGPYAGPTWTSAADQLRDHIRRATTPSEG